MSSKKKTSTNKRLSNIISKHRTTGLVLVAIIFGGLGIYALASSRAAGFLVQSEAETGIVAGNAAAVDVTTASAGKAVKFGNATNPNPNPNPTPGGMPVITREGTKLMRNGKQWKFAGINADKWFGCWGGAQVPSDAQLDKYFKELNPGSATRIWPYGHMGQVGMMDKIVSYAEKYNQYLVVTLFDGNSGQCGTKAINTGSPQVNIDQMSEFVKRYAKGTGANATNSIAFWESSNEECGDGSVNWFIKMADAFKAIDPNTLVSTGSMPRYCYSGQGAYEAAHGGKNDLISIHEYDNGYSHWSGPAIEAAKKLSKPWYSGESGVCCGGGDTGNASSNAGKIKGEMDQYINQTESAGMLYWASRTTSTAYDVDINGGAIWDMFKNYRHPYQGL